ncbi:YidH family protein [Acinetobacter nectaris]|uniref:YidH family protein n=1 Tax=Acinetobacter nectaris TaxID=1219382 RepID=UPI001F2F49B8|nr:DUF202 domain-containing protein [Acinetobacter nectaris]MCF8999373.1 DUF202 domain-containing protein [Acinetobacter nectaris]MCF9026654.1 DUF202 domain-containing protein [Acinetobacter nectaris]
MSNLNDPRVLLALERTLLAWNRSGLGLIAFGFVLERSTVLGSFLNPNGEAHKILLSKAFAVIIVILGIIISLWSVRQYKVALKSLTESEMIEGYRTDLPMFLTMISVLCGCLLIITFFV